MKDTIYLKIAKARKGYKYSVGTKKNLAPLHNAPYRSDKKKYYPTVVVALNLDVPDTHFRQAQAELDLFIKDPEIAKDITVQEALPNEPTN